MSAIEIVKCPKCYGDKEIEGLPGIFEPCPLCVPNTNRMAALNIRCMPYELKTSFRIWCLSKELSMKDAIIALMGLAIEQDLDLTEGG